MRLPRSEPRKGRIEIIPMIDTIFFLLVYFIMISLSMIRMDTHGVNRPRSAMAAERARDKVVLSITKSGELFLDRDPVSDAELLPQLKAMLNENPRMTIILNCDRDRQVDRFLQVFDLVKRANAAKVMIATSPRPIETGGGR